MPTEAEQVHVDVDEARAASTPNVVRWVLLVSLGAAIVLLTAIWVIGAWSSHGETQDFGEKVRAQQERAGGSQTDSIVGDHADQMNATTQGESNEPQNTPNKHAGP